MKIGLKHFIISASVALFSSVFQAATPFYLQELVPDIQALGYTIC